MFAVLVVAMVLILLWAAISPESMWSTTSAWQYRDPEANEPSDAAYAVQRVGAVLGLVLIAILVLVVVNWDPPKPAAPRPTWADDILKWSTPSISRVTPSATQAFPTQDDSVLSADTPTLMTVLPDAARNQGYTQANVSTASVQGTYYQWLAEDHPQAVASAPVVDSSVALSTRNRDAALTGDTGEELLGEDSYLLVRLDVPACAVTDASISADGYAHALTVSVTILKDTALCGQTTDRPLVAVALTPQQVQQAQDYESPAYSVYQYHGYGYGQGRGQSYSRSEGYYPSIFRYKGEVHRTDQQHVDHLASKAMVPWRLVAKN